MPKSKKTPNDSPGFAADSKPPRFPSPMVPTNSNTPPEIRVFQFKEFPLVFGYGSFCRHVELISRLEAANWECIYVLEGPEDDGKIVREGRTGDLRARLSAHRNTSEYRCFDRIAILTGPSLSEDDVKVAECLLSRQIRAVGAAKHWSKGPEMPDVDDVAWNKGREAFLAFRAGADLVGMGYLEPDSPGDVAAYWSCADAMRDRWLPGAIAMRKAQICEKASIMGPRLELDWGDYIAIAENRDCIFWLLAGSEVRANTVMSARKRHRTVRSELVDAGKAVEVRGYPDRLQLLVDLEVGTSVDAVTKFVLGSAASTDCWRAFKPKLPQGSKDLSSPVGVTADPRPG